MEKTVRKFVPALLILLISAAMIGASTYAWFSMNNRVSVTGMTVTTRVDENMLIADDPDGLASTARVDDSKFGNTIVQSVSALLEPVSTVDGENFYYTGKKNVKGNGDAMNDVYKKYDPANATSVSDFKENYGSDEAVGFVDYVFQLKAVNDSTLSEIRLTKLDLTYGGASTNVKVGSKPTEGTEAYRVAVFAEDITNTAPSGDVGTKIALFKTRDAKNFTAGEGGVPYKAVNGETSLANVAYCNNDTTAKLTIAAGNTKYYKIVVRMWLEGEDTTCKNDTYIRLNDEWKLDIEFELVSADETANSVVYINQRPTANKTSIGTNQEIATAVSYVINDVNYYAVEGKSLVDTDPAEALYVTSTDPVTPDTLYYVITDDGLYAKDVTNRVEFNAIQVDSTYAAVTLDGSGKMKKTGAADTYTPATYAWKKADGSEAPGTNDEATYTPTTSGAYFCYITADDGKVYKTASYTVVNADTLANGNIIATLYNATSYDWKKADGSDVENGNVQTLTPALAKDAGTYYCVIVKDTLTYYSLPITVVAATAGETPNEDKGTVTLDEGKLSNGVTPDTYSWKKGGSIAAGTSTTYEYTAEESGNFYCVIKGTDGLYYRTAVVALVVEP